MWKQRILNIFLGIGLTAMLVSGVTLLTYIPVVWGESPDRVQGKNKIPKLKISLTDTLLQKAQSRITRNPETIDGYIDLAQAHMRKARESGSATHYLQAETAIQKILMRKPDAYKALRVLAWIQLGKHEFQKAALTAKRLLQQRPNDPWAYGLLGDALVELGKYPQAVEAFQEMMDRRPGLPAYSRAAYITALYGNVEQATELMAMAVMAGGLRDPEPLAWTLVQYGHLHFQQGGLKVAEAAYTKALQIFPNYYMALSGLGKVRAGQKRFGEAIERYEEAIAIIPAPDLVSELGDLFAITNRPQEAQRQYDLVEFMGKLNEVNQMTYGRQLILFYADHDRNLETALTMVQAESKKRKDIYTYDALAWTYYKAGRLKEAWNAMEQANRLGTQDATLFFHAGMIADGLGKTEMAKTYLQKALTLNPYFSPIGAKTAQQRLETLTATKTQQETSHVS